MYEAVSQTTYTVYGPYPNYPVIQPHHLPDRSTTYGPLPDPSTTYGPLPDPSTTYGPYPPQNYQPHYYPDPNVTYGPPVVPPLGNEAFGPVSYGTSINNNSFRQFPRKSKKKQKKPKIVMTNRSVCQSVPCKLCKIECGSVTEYEKHLIGKKHNKCLMKMYSSTMVASVRQSSTETNVLGGQGMSRVSSVPPDLEAKKQKLFEGGTMVQFMRVCAICNIACNGDKAISDHFIGKKHIAQERALNAKANPSNISASNPGSNSHNPTKKITVVGPGYCEVCKISCTSNESLVIHRQGKRHKKNLENLRKSISDITQPSSSSSSAPVGPGNLPTAVLDNHVPVVGPMPESEQVKKKGARSVEPAGMESKKRRVLECGADAGAVRTCNICNVVCNSETVFNTHLAGQKHATLVKRAAVESCSQ